MKSTCRPTGVFVLVVLGSLLHAPGSRAEAPAPPPPALYRVYLRYDLKASGFNRLYQFRDMVERLRAVGFKKDQGPDDEEVNASFTSMTGTIAAEDARRLLTVYLVKAILLYPKGYTLPADPSKPVKVVIDLPGSTGIYTRRRVVVQLRPYLDREGLREFVAYDNRRQTRIVGTIPAGRVENLLNDLSVVPLENPPPDPLKIPWPIRIVEVIQDPRDEEINQFVPLPEPPPELATIAPDLRARLPLPGEKAGDPERVEVILRTMPGERDTGYEQRFTATAPGTVIEQRLGPVLTIKTSLDHVPVLAKLPDVNALRLPHPAAPVFTRLPAAGDAVAEALHDWSVDRLHQAGARGKGIRVAVIADDFRGYERFVGNGLPVKTRLIDLTAERTDALEPEPPPDDKREFGSGADLALAVALAAPEAELVLLRVVNTAPAQLDTLARYINGQGATSPALNYRSDELKHDEASLRSQREALRKERQAVLDDYGQDDAARQRRQDYDKRQAEFDARDAALRRRKERYTNLLRDLASLRAIPVVVSSLVWNEGYPIGGASALTHRINDAPTPTTLWLVAAGDTQGQAWTGLFRDEDDNGVMEFAAADAPLPPERWSHELNFLAWKPHAAAKPVADLPENTALRLSLQWREAHDPEVNALGGDPYRQPLAHLYITVLRQNDPTGKNVSADEMEVVARSVGLPLRIDVRPESAVYEQLLEVTLDRPGRYAVRIEGRPRLSTRPSSLLSVQGQEKSWELRPRLFVQAPAATGGRPVWLDYVADRGDVGMPADAYSVVTVGSADGQGGRRGTTSLGPPHDLRLLAKPDIFVPDGLRLREEGGLATGTAISAGFAAGAAASALSGGIPPQALIQQWRNRGGTSWVSPPLPPPLPTRR